MGGRDSSVSSDELVEKIGSEIQEDFANKKRILSFEEYIRIVSEGPWLHARNSAQYMLDAFDYYGRDRVRRTAGEVTRYKLFDVPFDGGRDRLIGQESCQEEIYRALKNFVQEGKVDKLVLLHGPNGSAKSRIISCMARALVHYSHTDDGALYCFSWIFPGSKISKKKVGFGGEARHEKLSTFAYLDREEIDAQIQCELRDPPLFLFPKPNRRTLLKRFLARSDGGSSFDLSDYILNGDLSMKNRQIYETLLNTYKGDLSRVLQHIQVQRFFISRRYRVGAVTIEPQLHVDAGSRQLTMDRSLNTLPHMLQNLSLFEVFGDLVNANRGFVEYNDLLKRPLDAFKYLLSTCEKSTAALPNCTIYLDTVFIGSSNEKHLMAFKEIPDWTSFKGRIELVRVPYILDSTVEEGIYTDQVTSAVVGKHVAPHTTSVAALWAVLTRMRKPDPQQYSESIRSIVEKLTPLEKAELYALGKVPVGVAISQGKELLSSVEAMLEESRGVPDYEGRIGASPREIKTLLLNAAQNQRYRCLSPPAVFDELEALVKDRTIYEFLKLEPNQGYYDHQQFISHVRDRYLDELDDEVRDSMGLVSEEQYVDLFSRYVTQVSAWLRGEKVRNRVTGRLEPPDEKSMKEMDEIFRISKDPKEFRQEVISTIGAWALDHKNEPVDHRKVFPKLFHLIEEDYYHRHKRTIRKIKDDILRYFTDARSELSSNEVAQVEQTLNSLVTRYQYCEHCAKDAVSFLQKQRYEE